MKKTLKALVLAASLTMCSMNVYASSGTDNYDYNATYTFTRNARTVGCSGIHRVGYTYSAGSITCNSGSVTVSSRSNCTTSTSQGSATAGVESGVPYFSRPDYVMLKSLDDKQYASASIRTKVSNNNNSLTISHTQSYQCVKDER